MATSVRYSLTVTLKPLQYKEFAEKQYDNTCMYLINKLTMLNCQYTLVAEMTKACNIHYHGTIEFLKCHKNQHHRKYLIDHFRNDKMIGYVCMKQITDEPGWIEYIKKDIVGTTEVLNRRPILKDDFDYFDMDEIASYGCHW